MTATSFNRRPTSCPLSISTASDRCRRSVSLRPPGGRPQRDSAPTPEKRHSRGRAGKGLARIGGREHAVHEPLISRAMRAEVPLTELSFG